MGIEIWVLVALVAILAVYLLPFLVGRREVMRLSNAEDRYSSELRVLATGDALASDDYYLGRGEGCDHADEAAEGTSGGCKDGCDCRMFISCKGDNVMPSEWAPHGG